MAASRACFHEKQYIFNDTTGAAIPSKWRCFTNMTSSCKPPIVINITLLFEKLEVRVAHTA